jgi:hypothetical protein
MPVSRAWRGSVVVPLTHRAWAGREKMHMRFRIFAAFVVGLMVSAGTASATALGLVKGLPDTNVTFASAQYNAATDVLTVSASAGTLTQDGTTFSDDFLGTFILTAKVDASGNLVADAGNVFTITGSNGGPAVTKLTGSLTSFGFSTLGSPTGQNTKVYEFQFVPTGGQHQAIYGSAGGMIFTFPSTGATGANFATSFELGSGTGDVFATTGVPVPAALPAGLVLLGGTVALRMRKRRLAK